MHPSGKWAYAVSSKNPGAAVVQYTIGADGTLARTSSAATTFVFPNFLAIHPSGKYLYVTIQNGSVDQYTIDQTTGALSAMTPASVTFTAAGTTTFAIAVHPSGKSPMSPTISAPSPSTRLTSTAAPFRHWPKPMWTAPRSSRLGSRSTSPESTPMWRTPVRPRRPSPSTPSARMEASPPAFVGLGVHLVLSVQYDNQSGHRQERAYAEADSPTDEEALNGV